MSRATLTVGTRTSALARWQTAHVVESLQRAHESLTFDVTPYRTSGDITLDVPLPAIGGKGAFTAELEHALRAGDIDIAVHSLKDLPVAHAEGLTVAAVLTRADARDAVVARHGHTLATLPKGAVVGTSSLRRAAQLQRLRPDLVLRSIRGNVETRIRKVLEDGAYDATILALAGLDRLALTAQITERLGFDVMLPAPGQGALAVQCRADDDATIARLRAIDDADTHAATTAERAFLHALQGGCSAPVAALAQREPSGGASGGLVMRGLVALPDGTRVVAVQGRGDDAWALGTALAADARTQGADEILAHVRALT